MGYYIETNANHDKADFLVRTFGARRIPAPASFPVLPDNEALVMVVDNVAFEAAGYIYDEREFDAASPSATDKRHREWLVMEKKTVEYLTGYKKAGVK